MKHYVKALCTSEEHQGWEIFFGVAYPIDDTYLMFNLGSEDKEHLDELLKMYILGAITEKEYKRYLSRFDAIPYWHRKAKKAFERISK